MNSCVTTIFPVEIWENIFSFLTINEMCRISTVCKLWNDFANCTSFRKILIFSKSVSNFGKEKAIDILKTSPQLLHLRVNRWQFLKDEYMFLEISKYCPNLKSLIIMNDVHYFTSDLCSIILKCKNIHYLEIHGLCKYLCLNCALVYLHFFELEKEEEEEEEERGKKNDNRRGRRRRVDITCDGVNIDIQENKQKLENTIVSFIHTMRCDMKWYMLYHNIEIVKTIHRRIRENGAINAERAFGRVMKKILFMNCICYFCNLLQNLLESELLEEEEEENT